MKAMKVIMAVTAIQFASAVFAGVTTEGTTIIFDVAANQTETYDVALSGEYVKLIKKGAGTMVMTRATADFKGSTRSVEIQSGVLRFDVSGAVGGYVNFTIGEGAQFYANYGMGQEYSKYSPLAFHFKSICGSGPDGTGAIRINNKTNTPASWADWRSCFRNEVTLGGDTTIQVDSATIIGFNADSTLNLNGHTLTMTGAGRLYFGKENLGTNPPRIGVGHIVDNMTGDTIWFRTGAQFAGTAENTLTLGDKVTNIIVDSLENPFPWKLVSTTTSTSKFRIEGNTRNGVFDPTQNEFAGGMEFKCGRMDVEAHGEDLSDSNPRVVTFSGKLKSTAVGSVAQLVGYNDFANNRYLTINLKSANECGFTFYTGTCCAYVDGALGTSGEISLASNGTASVLPGTVRVLLGSGRCSGSYAANVASRVSAWRGDTSNAGKLELQTDGDYAIDGSFSVATPKIRLVHVGSGKLTFNGTVSDTPVRISESNDTVFNKDLGTYTRVVFDGTGTPGACVFGPDFSGTFLFAYMGDVGFPTVFHQLGGSVGASGTTPRLTGGNGLGFYALEAGTLQAPGTNPIGSDSSYANDVLTVGKSVFQQDGGELANASSLYLSCGGETDYLMRGGRVVFAENATAVLSVGSTSDAVDESQTVLSLVDGNPLFDASASNTYINMSSRLGNAYSTVINLNAGEMRARNFAMTHGTGHSRIYFNFNGGALTWCGRNYIWANNALPTALTIYEKGFTVVAGYDDGEGDARMFFTDKGLSGDSVLSLRAMSGKGIARITLPADMPKTGYKGIAPVRVVTATGDAGWGATASLDFDVATGTVGDELLITCPGNDYGVAPTVVACGPDMKTAYACAVELTSDGRVPGPFVKRGAGELVLNLGNGGASERETSPHNTYPGPYIISNGCLMVNNNSSIPQSSKVFVAGGCFRWDWTTRTIAEFGGWGTFFGCKDNNSKKLTVTTRYVVDAADLAAGRSLELDMTPGDDAKTAIGDDVVFGDDCMLRVDNVECLSEDVGDYKILKQGSINRVPQLETPIKDWKLKKRKAGTELHLVCMKGLTVVIR